MVDDNAFMNAIWNGVENMPDAEADAASVGVRGLRAVMELDAELAIGGLLGFVGNSAGRGFGSLAGLPELL